MCALYTVDDNYLNLEMQNQQLLKWKQTLLVIFWQYKVKIRPYFKQAFLIRKHPKEKASHPMNTELLC